MWDAFRARLPDSHGRAPVRRPGRPHRAAPPPRATTPPCRPKPARCLVTLLSAVTMAAHTSAAAVRDHRASRRTNAPAAPRRGVSRVPLVGRSPTPTRGLCRMVSRLGIKLAALLGKRPLHLGAPRKSKPPLPSPTRGSAEVATIRGGRYTGSPAAEKSQGKLAIPLLTFSAPRRTFSARHLWGSSCRGTCRGVRSRDRMTTL